MDAALFQKYQLPTKTRNTEWGDLLRFFTEQLNQEIEARPFYIDASGKKRKLTKWSEPRVAAKIARLKHGDDLSKVYYLRSICLDSKARTGSFGKCFNGYLKV